MGNALMLFSFGLSLLLALLTPLGVGRANLVIVSASATYSCSNKSNAVSVSIANSGSAFSVPQLNTGGVSVQDSSAPPRWTGHADLPAVPPQGTVTVRISLKQAAVPAVSPQLPLVVTLASQKYNVTTVQSIGCGQPITLHTGGIVGIQPSAQPGPLHLPPLGIRPRPNPVAFIAPPSGLNYTTDPSVCYKLVGFFGAFICPQLVQNTGLLLLYWSWAPCHTSTCMQNIQGYNIYPVATRHYGPRHRLDQQTDPNSMFRGISPYSQGECLVVTAYGHGQESDDSNTLCIGANAFLNTPWGTNGYVGLQSHNVYLTWNWGGCAAAGCVKAADGYNIYLVGGQFVTSANKTEASAGQAQVGACYVIRAYKGQIQSDPSSPFCVTQQMMPSPPPTPTNVTIDITDDSFPANTIVAVGGTVTWKNDDNDIHDVNGAWGWLSPIDPGSSTSYTFTHTGLYDYVCDYHHGMQGRITVVAH